MGSTRGNSALISQPTRIANVPHAASMPIMPDPPDAMNTAGGQLSLAVRLEHAEDRLRDTEQSLANAWAVIERLQAGTGIG